MKKTVLASAVAVTWCVAAPFAQQPPAPTAKTTPAHNVFLLTGCLEAGADPTATFKLTNASSIGQAPPAGATGAVGTSGQKPSYELRPVSGVDAQGMDADALKKYVGRRVEMIVRPIESPAAAPSPALSGVQPAKPLAPEPQRFSVTEIKRVIGACSD